MARTLKVLFSVAMLSLLLGACRFDGHTHEHSSLVGQECEDTTFKSAVSTLVL